MDKRDPYHTKEKWETWKKTKIFSVELSKKNKDLIIKFLDDLEQGKNISKLAPKGERSPIRLLAIKSRLTFIASHNKDFLKLDKDKIHDFFSRMKSGKILKSNGEKYLSTKDYIKDLKTFWTWLIKMKYVKEDITEDLSGRADEKPHWVYLDEQKLKTLANRCNADYRAIVWLLIDSGCRVTELNSLKVNDFLEDFSKLCIREEISKNKYGRTIHLKLCTPLIKEYVEFHNLKKDDFLFQKTPQALNMYLKRLSKKIFGSGESHPKAKGKFNKTTAYDLRHSASCYWLQRYKSHRALMYRMGWSSEKLIRYYSEFLGQSDEITDEDMVLTEDKGKVESQARDIEIMKKQIKLLNNKLMSAEFRDYKRNETIEQLRPYEDIPGKEMNEMNEIL